MTSDDINAPVCLFLVVLTFMNSNVLHFLMAISHCNFTMELERSDKNNANFWLK